MTLGEIETTKEQVMGKLAKTARGPGRVKRVRMDLHHTAPSHGESAERPWLLLTFLMLAEVVGVVYFNTLGNGFVFDDPELIGLDPAVSDPWILFQKMGRGTWWLGYRPLRTASYALDYALFGRDPLGYHLSNITYHALSGFVAYLIAFRLLGQHLPALIVATLFLVHPVQTDSVTYLSGRRDVLFGLFYLLAFFAFLRYRDTHLKRYLGLAVLGYLFSLSAKQMAVTLPLLCLTYDLMWTDRSPRQESSVWMQLWERIKEVWRRDQWLYLAMGIFALLFVLHFGFLHKPTRQVSYYGDSFALTMLTVARIVIHYLKLLVFPRTLIADYSYDAFPITPTLTHWPSLAAVLFLAVLIVLLIRVAPGHRLASFGGAWFFLTLLPVTHIIPHHELMAEHYLYIPSFGLFLAAGYVVGKALERQAVPPSLLYPAVILIILVLSLRTVRRNADWKDNLTLWRKTVQDAPQVVRARNNLGASYLNHGQLEQAQEQLEVALKINPEFSAAYTNLGKVYLLRNDLAQAEQAFTTAIRLGRNGPGVRLWLGEIYTRMGRMAEAEEQIRAALSKAKRPFDAYAYNNLGTLFAKSGRIAEAESAFKEALRRMPALAQPKENLARLSRRQAHSELAADLMKRVVP